MTIQPPDYSNWSIPEGEAPSADQSPIIPGRPSQPASLPATPEYGTNTVSLVPTAMQQRPELLSKSVPTTPLMPVAPSGVAAINAAAQSVTQIVTSESPSVSLQTNGIPNPSQTVLNLVAGSNMTITPGAGGSVTFAAAGGGDGLIHGETPWESDPSFVLLRDDFNTGTVTSPTIGSLGWTYSNNTGGSISYSGAAFPVNGTLTVPNSTTVNGYDAFWLKWDNGSTAIQGWPLFDYPAWKVVYIFSLDLGILTSSSSQTFSMAKKSLYIGLGYNLANNPCVRPATFCGLRFDTSTTSPSIGDTDFVFECVCNPSGSSGTRNNTQGNTFSTGIAPALGVWYRLEILCTTAGSVTMSLSDGSTTVTSTLAMPKYSEGTGTSAILSNGVWLIDNSSFYSQAAGGTKITLAGLTRSTALNGIQVAAMGATSGAATSLFGYSSDSAVSSGSETGTQTYYSALMPLFSFGNDNESSPVFNAALEMDFFSFVWNPGVGGGTGTPNSNKARYW